MCCGRTAGLLQLFLGGFGIGRWYIGTHGVAAGQLVLWFLAFVTSFIFGIGLVLFVGLGIWVLVDAIMIFTGSVRDGDGRVLR
ncbi:hypothetical protein ACE11G_03270 [Gordonia sp. PS3]|uniref:hypothetical protein n=1 Tax=Gordonia TaxID=2053 RepID=UPI0012E96257|nr:MULTISPECIES: hypothetical protein [Gordonia]